MGRKEWLSFYHPNGRLLCSYTVAGTFAFECRNTKKLLAAENGIKEHEIKVKLTKTQPKPQEKEQQWIWPAKSEGGGT